MFLDQRLLLPLTLGAALFAQSGVASAETVAWTADPAHSQVGFVAKHMMVQNVRGLFKKFDVTLTLDEKDVTKSSVDVVIDANSVDTGVADRDNHLRGEDFFNVAKTPNITFKSTKVAKGGKDKLKVTGDLTIGNVTKPVTLDVTGPSKDIKDPWGNVKRSVSASTTIKRKDFNLTWNKALEAGGVLVSEDIKIDLEIQLAKKA